MARHREKQEGVQNSALPGAHGGTIMAAVSLGSNAAVWPGRCTGCQPGQRPALTVTIPAFYSTGPISLTGKLIREKAFLSKIQASQ